MADQYDTLTITQGENPDIVFEFYTGEEETDPRIDLTGATIAVTSNIPNLPLTYTGDITQGIVMVAIPLNVAAAMKTFVAYYVTITAVDVDSKRHVAKVKVKAT